MNIREFNRYLRRLPVVIERAAAVGLTHAAELVKEEAKSRIDVGTDLLPLVEATVEEKAHLGFPPDPLMRTGTLRDSIQVEVAGMTALIGSPLDYAFYQEHGTTTIPPRPFLHPALHTKLPEVAVVIEQHIAAALAKIA